MLFSSVTGSRQCILGYSYVCWGTRRVDVRPNGRQLGFSRQEACVRWLGFPGMLWSRMVSEVHRFVRLDRPPDVLILHVGGNDLGVRSMLDVTRDIKFDMAFPAMIIVWQR